MYPKKPALSELIKAARKEKGWTQDDLALKAKRSLDTISRWETGRHIPRPRMAHVLRCVLDISNPDWRSAEQRSKASKDPDNAPFSSQPYDVLSIADLQRNGFEPQRALEQVPDLIADWDEFDPGGPENDMGPDEKWDAIALKSSNTHFVLVEEGQSVVGYWSFVPIRSNMYHRIYNGENVNKELNHGDVALPIRGDEVSLYFIDLFSRNQINPALMVSKVLETMQGLLVDWERQGILVQSVIAHLSTPMIIAFCEQDLGFEIVAHHQVHTMYVDPINKVKEKTRIGVFDMRKHLVAGGKVQNLLNEVGLLKSYREAFA